MKPSTVPIFCGFALTAMSTAVLSHWWSLRQFIAITHTAAPISARSAPLLAQAPAPPAVPPAAAPATNKSQKDFYESLIAKMNGLQSQNRDLLDQLAETNRDIMKLEFRVDTHSESFRPLPVTEDSPFTSLDDKSGVLPPRAEPVRFPTQQ
jgi:hypothetical protein